MSAIRWKLILAVSLLLITGGLVLFAWGLSVGGDWRFQVPLVLVVVMGLFLARIGYDGVRYATHPKPALTFATLAVAAIAIAWGFLLRGSG